MPLDPRLARLARVIDKGDSYSEMLRIIEEIQDETADVTNEQLVVLSYLRNAIVHKIPERVSELRAQLEHLILQASVTVTNDVEPLTVYIDPGNASEELLTEFFVALASVYRAYGGSGLEIVSDERRSFAGELAQ